MGLDWEVAALARSFLSHCLFKQFLTEGERIVMTFGGLLSFADQGVYDVIHNLGSLIARIIFAPLEEAAHTFFSQNLRRGVDVKDQDPIRLATATRMLRFLLQLTMLMGLLVSVFGWSYARLALLIYAGPRLATGIAPLLLRLYCPYVLLLALNGISESFLFTIIPPPVMGKHRRVLAATCATFITIVWLGGNSIGTPVFVLANSVGMVIRIGFSLYYIHRFYAELPGDPQRVAEAPGDEYTGNPLKVLIPNATIGLILLGSLAMTQLTELLFTSEREPGMFNYAAHLLFGAGAFLFTLIMIYSKHQSLVRFIDDHIVHKKHKND